MPEYINKKLTRKLAAANIALPTLQSPTQNIIPQQAMSKKKIDDFINKIIVCRADGCMRRSTCACVSVSVVADERYNHDYHALAGRFP